VVWTGDHYEIEVVHNRKNGGVVVTSLYEFSDGQPVFLYGVPASPEHAQLILATAEANLGQPYATFVKEL
jgi:hypothetical protein